MKIWHDILSILATFIILCCLGYFTTSFRYGRLEMSPFKYAVGYKFRASSPDWGRQWTGEILSHNKDNYSMKLVPIPISGSDTEYYEDNPFDTYDDDWMDEHTTPLTPLEQLL